MDPHGYRIIRHFTYILDLNKSRHDLAHFSTVLSRFFVCFELCFEGLDLLIFIFKFLFEIHPLNFFFKQDGHEFLVSCSGVDIVPQHA